MGECYEKYMLYSRNALIKCADSSLTNEPFWFRMEFAVLFCFVFTQYINTRDWVFISIGRTHRQLMKCELRQILVLVILYLFCVPVYEIVQKQLLPFDDNLTRSYSILSLFIP